MHVVFCRYFEEGGRLVRIKHLPSSAATARANTTTLFLKHYLNPSTESTPCCSSSSGHGIGDVQVDGGAAHVFVCGEALECKWLRETLVQHGKANKGVTAAVEQLDAADGFDALHSRLLGRLNDTTQRPAPLVIVVDASLIPTDVRWLCPSCCDVCVCVCVSLSRSHTHTHTQTHRPHTQTHTDTHRHTDTQTHRHTHRHTQTHTHAPGIGQRGARCNTAALLQDGCSTHWRCCCC